MIFVKALLLSRAYLMLGSGSVGVWSNQVHVALVKLCSSLELKAVDLQKLMLIL